MRKVLDSFYDGCAWLAALCMIGILVMVLLTIAGRLMGFHVPGSDAYAGFSMAGAGFLAMAHTLKRNEHIRVTLIIGKLAPQKRRFAELFALFIGILLSGVLAFYSLQLAIDSHAFNDRSASFDATPLWIPQTMMVVGTTALFMAFVDEWVLELLGRRTVTESSETYYE